MKFNNCIFEGNVSIYSHNLDKEYREFGLEPQNSQIEFNECTFKSTFIKGKGDYGSLKFTNCIFEDTLKIEDVLEVTIENKHHKIKASINTLCLNISKTTEKITISNQFISNLECKGNFLGTFICRDSVINKLTFDDFTNEKDFKLLNVRADKPDGELVVKDSYLGKMYWSSVDFGAMHTAQIENSTLIDLIPTNLKLPKNIVGQNETDFEGTKEACRQLKYIYNKQSNLSEELKYKQLEMEAFSRQQNLPWGDKFILWSNRYTSNHGQSWVRAACCILVFTSLSFTLIKFGIGDENFKLANFPNDAVSFLKLIFSPIHNDLTAIFGANKKWNWGNLLVIITKIGNGYLLYQLYQASRKFVR